MSIFRNRYFPDRKVLGFGLTGIVAFVIMHILGTIEFEQALMYANVIGGIAMYVLPPSAHDVIKRLDKIVKDKSIPLVEEGDTEHA